MKKIICLLFILNNAAQASAIQVDVTGTIGNAYGYSQYDPTTNSFLSSGESPDLKSGDKFSYQLKFNETKAVDDPSYGNPYKNAVLSFSGQAGNFNFAGDSGYVYTISDDGTYKWLQANHGDVITYNSANGIDPDFDNTNGQINGADLALAQFFIQQSTGVITGFYNTDLTANKLPTVLDNTNFTAFGYLNLYFYNPSNLNQYTAFGYIDTIKVTNLNTPAAVPVPAAFWLLSSALMGLLGIKKRKSVLKVSL